MWESLPEFGTGVLYAVLVTAAYTFAVCIGAGTRQSETAAERPPGGLRDLRVDPARRTDPRLRVCDARFSPELRRSVQRAVDDGAVSVRISVGWPGRLAALVVVSAVDLRDRVRAVDAWKIPRTCSRTSSRR